MLSIEFLGISPPETKGLIPRIWIKLRITNQIDVGLLILSCEGGIAVNGYYAGKVSRIYPVSLEPQKSVDCNILWEIPYDVLERIERLRNGGRLQIQIDVAVLAIICGMRDKVMKSLQYLRQAYEQNNVGEYDFQFSDNKNEKAVLRLICPVIDPKTGKHEITVTVDEWLEVLSRLDFKRVRIVELPELAPNSDPNLNAVIEELDKAWKLMSQNFEESLNACRKALENFRDYIKKRGFIKVVEDSEGKKKEKIDFKKLYNGERFGDAMDKIFTGLWTLTDIGSHAGRSKLTTRADMEFVMTSIYLLLKSVVENLKR
jgi:hypothetical protein